MRNVIHFFSGRLDILRSMEIIQKIKLKSNFESNQYFEITISWNCENEF